MILHTKRITQGKKLLAGTLAVLFGAGVLSGCSVPSKQESCSLFRKGDFSLTYKNEKGSPTFLITRTDSIQTEINQQTGNYSKLSISWTSDCTYELRLIETSESVSDNEKIYRMMFPLEVEIIQPTKKYYVFRKRRYPDKNYTRDTMWVRK